MKLQIFLTSKKLTSVTIKAATIIIFGLLWQFISSSGIVNRSLFPPPTSVYNAFIEWMQSGFLWTDLGGSLWRMLIGFFIGSAFGIIIGMLTGRIKSLRLTVVPLIQLFRPLPPVAIIPLIIVWLGIGNTAKIFSISFAVFFPVWINTHLGASTIAKDYLRSASLLASSGTSLFFSVLLPAALSSIIAGLRTGIPIAYVMVYVSEIAGASEGLGYRISISHLAYRIDTMMAALFVLALAGALTDIVFTFFIKKMFPWIKFL